MFVSEDGYVNGSVDNSKLDEVKPKSDEARARLEQLKAERDAGQEQVDRDTERLAELHKAQSIEGQRRDVVTSQGDRYAAPTADQAAAKQDTSDAEVARLQAEAEQAGVTVDKRWGADRLQAEIDAAKAAKTSGKK